VYDVFISHATEDKEAIADPLAKELTKRGLKVWYGTERIALRDNLRIAIDAGLAESTFGVVLISQAFLRKAWTTAELGGLMATSTGLAKRILPVLHGVSADEIARHAPTLAGKAFATTAEGLAGVCDRICRAVTGDDEPANDHP
jgi:TIR domain-containing protein